MGKLTETEKWEDEVYQIETSDPVLGGPDGVSNRPQKQLANRTQWLKKQLEETNIALAGHERSRNHPDATLTDRGFVKLYSGVASMDETMAATPKAVKIAMDNANARLAKDQNLNDVPDKAKARAALGLGDVATRYIGTRPGTVAAGNDARIIGAIQKDQNGADIPNKPAFVQNLGLTEAVNRALNAVQKTGDTMTGSLFLKNDGRMHFAIANADGNIRMWLYKDKGGDGVRLNNGVDGGGEFVFNKNSEFYSPSHLHAGAAIFGNNGDVYGSVWENNWLSIWLNNQFAARDNNINARVTSDYVNQTFVRAVRLGPQAFSGALWRDYQLGGGNVVTGFHTDGDWEMEGNDDHVYYRPVQYLVNGTWVTAASV
ncbi:tail fiber protein [Salmonella enterica]|nr:tail fiber protein [Salmonella enterica]EKD7537087.1 tail fiber protein [Salmonella enterica]EKD7558192.1 tail fiber protein [Salmonella enterica]EKD7560049.1 tail fiber protein [Salmonella enterica]